MNERMTSERQQRASERILEDEGLTGDLTDHQARPLIEWASSLATALAADPALSDAAVDAAVGAIRRAVLQVASAAPDEHDPERLVALARAALQHIAPDVVRTSDTFQSAPLAPTPETYSAAACAQPDPNVCGDTPTEHRAPPTDQPPVPVSAPVDQAEPRRSIWQRLLRWRDRR